MNQPLRQLFWRKWVSRFIDELIIVCLHTTSTWHSYQHHQLPLALFLVFQTILCYLDKSVPLVHCTDLQQVTDTSAIGIGGNILHILLIYYGKPNFIILNTSFQLDFLSPSHWPSYNKMEGFCYGDFHLYVKTATEDWS